MKTDNNAMIDAINKIDGLSDEERVYMWVTMSDAEKLLDELKMSGTLASVGMKSVSLADQFAYGVLRLARPDLFESK